MTRWLVAPLLCALTIPSAAWAQPASPPAVEPASGEATAPAEAAQPAAADANADPAPTEAGPDAQPADATTTNTVAPDFGPIAQAPPPPTITAAPTPTPPPKPIGPQLDNRAEPLLAAGLGGFLGLYALTAYAGAASIDKARDQSRDDYGRRNGNMTRNRGRALLVPVAGPFIAMRFTNSARRKYWQAVNGGLQASTLVMALIGARMYNQHRKAKRRAQFTASASPQGGQVGMAMRF